VTRVHCDRDAWLICCDVVGRVEEQVRVQPVPVPRVTIYKSNRLLPRCTPHRGHRIYESVNVLDIVLKISAPEARREDVCGLDCDAIATERRSVAGRKGNDEQDE
jgi:hypothetical protein